jgi:alginate O-acetyltransferase complex protein AlgI
MVFSSVLFIFLFLPVFFLGYFLVKKTYRNTFLLFSSLFFYAWGETLLVLILITSLVINYCLSLLIDLSNRKNKEIPSLLSSKLLLTIAIVCNLIPLFYFKYSNFIVYNLSGICFPHLSFGQNWKEVVLPIGISFFTFQAMSYVIDVYRRNTSAAASFIDFSCYVTCFPQLIAGPIVRYKDISKQLLVRIVSINKFYDGTRLFIIGLAKKVLIADTLAKTADYSFNLPVDQLDMACSWLGAICYSLQIYYDFSGYSDMAIGMGLMLGFHFPQNFNYPYAAKSIQDFWRRWHISLSAWFRDYLYIPLGGNKCSKWRTYFNLWIVFLLCGLWHGASWNFILWGAFHGFFLVLERSKTGKLLISLPASIKHIYALFVVVTGWVLFRADTLLQAKNYLATMYGIGNGYIGISGYRINVLDNDIMLALGLGLFFSVPFDSYLKYIPVRMKKMKMAPLYFCILIVCLATLASNAYNPFLYFRF